MLLQLKNKGLRLPAKLHRHSVRIILKLYQIGMTCCMPTLGIEYFSAIDCHTLRTTGQQPAIRLRSLGRTFRHIGVPAFSAFFLFFATCWKPEPAASSYRLHVLHSATRLAHPDLSAWKCISVIWGQKVNQTSFHSKRLVAHTFFKHSSQVVISPCR